MNGLEASRRTRGRLRRIAILLGLAAWFAIFFSNAGSARAQTAQRSVQGRVVNANDVPIRSAIVYLSDQRTKTVESYITQEDGTYRFEQLSPNDNYKLWAQVAGKKSRARILSSFDDRAVFRVIIRIDTGK
ncbi:MAG: carboxypeptidase-like regulatory domain-containing protein [Acidobacteriaceae bacterium]